jgi:hypothetical protein
LRQQAPYAANIGFDSANGKEVQAIVMVPIGNFFNADDTSTFIMATAEEHHEGEIHGTRFVLKPGRQVPFTFMSWYCTKIMKKVVSGGPANTMALREPWRPFGYNPVELSRFAGAGLFGI